MFRNQITKNALKLDAVNNSELADYKTRAYNFINEYMLKTLKKLTRCAGIFSTIFI